jgi:hypothetical protein
MATKRKAKPPRAIPPAYPTGSAEGVGTAADRFYRDLEGSPAYQVIRDRETGEVFARRTLTATECHHEVAQRNAGVPLNSVSQSKLLSPTRKIKSDDPAQLSATEWVEWLMSHPPTVAKVRTFKPVGERALSMVDLEMLMKQTAPHVDFDEDMLGAVMQRLYRDFKIGHKR